MKLAIKIIALVLCLSIIVPAYASYDEDFDPYPDLELNELEDWGILVKQRSAEDECPHRIFQYLAYNVERPSRGYLIGDPAPDSPGNIDAMTDGMRFVELEYDGIMLAQFSFPRRFTNVPYLAFSLYAPGRKDILDMPVTVRVDGYGMEGYIETYECAPFEETGYLTVCTNQRGEGCFGRSIHGLPKASLIVLQIGKYIVFPFGYEWDEGTVYLPSCSINWDRLIQYSAILEDRIDNRVHVLPLNGTPVLKNGFRITPKKLSIQGNTLTFEAAASRVDANSPFSPADALSGNVTVGNKTITRYNTDSEYVSASMADRFDSEVVDFNWEADMSASPAAFRWTWRLPIHFNELPAGTRISVLE